MSLADIATLLDLVNRIIDRKDTIDQNNKDLKALMRRVVRVKSIIESTPSMPENYIEEYSDVLKDIETLIRKERNNWIMRAVYANAKSKEMKEYNDALDSLNSDYTASNAGNPLKYFFGGSNSTSSRPSAASDSACTSSSLLGRKAASKLEVKSSEEKGASPDEACLSATENCIEITEGIGMLCLVVGQLFLVCG